MKKRGKLLDERLRKIAESVPEIKNEIKKHSQLKSKCIADRIELLNRKISEMGGTPLDDDQKNTLKERVDQELSAADSMKGEDVLKDMVDITITEQAMEM